MYPLQVLRKDHPVLPPPCAFPACRGPIDETSEGAGLLQLTDEMQQQSVPIPLTLQKNKRSAIFLLLTWNVTVDC